MKQFLAFIKKEFHHIFRDVRTIMLIIGIPIAQILIIGFAVSTEVKNVKTAVYDPSNDISTQQIIQRLDASEYFDVVQLLQSPEDIDRLFKEGKIAFAVVFSEHFNENLYHNGGIAGQARNDKDGAAVQLIADASDPNQGLVATSYAANILGDYQQELLGRDRARPVPTMIIPQIQMLYNPEMQSSYNFVPGLMGLVFILICAMMTSIAIVREKETGTMEVLLASPMKPMYIVISKMVPYFIISWFTLILILLMSVFVLHVPIVGNLLWLNIFSLVYIIVALALGLLISTLVNTQVAALLASGMGLMMPFMILSGMIFPIASMPPVLQWVSCIIPARWYIAGVRKIMIEGASVQHIWTEMSVLIGMIVVILGISLKKFKTRLE
ncbi:transport permease protein [Bacteroidia bacterium]|nr:transport permease protein [Bacteroidia bacterium]GHT45282.1 transport permease protein [Bacteroidia bacterium]